MEYYTHSDHLQPKRYSTSVCDKTLSKWKSILFDMQCMDEDTVSQYIHMFHDILLHPTWFCSKNIMRCVNFTFHYSVRNIYDKSVFSYFRNNVAIYESDYNEEFLDTLEKDITTMVEDIYNDMIKRYTEKSNIVGNDIIIYHDKDIYGHYLDWPRVFIVCLHFK